MLLKPLFGATESVMQPRRLPDRRLTGRDSFACCRQTKPGMKVEQVVLAMDSDEEPRLGLNVSTSTFEVSGSGTLLFGHAVPRKCTPSSLGLSLAGFLNQLLLDSTTLILLIPEP